MRTYFSSVHLEMFGRHLEFLKPMKVGERMTSLPKWWAIAERGFACIRSKKIRYADFCKIKNKNLVVSYEERGLRFSKEIKLIDKYIFTYAAFPFSHLES